MKNNLFKYARISVAFMALMACAPSEANVRSDNMLTEQEQREGWELLWD